MSIHSTPRRPGRRAGVAAWLAMAAALTAWDAAALLSAQPPAPAEPESEEAVDPADDPALDIIRANVRGMVAAGALQQAAAEVERLIRRDPGSPSSQLLAVEVYFRLGKDAEVEAHAERARALDPASDRPDFWLARLARWRGNFAEARRRLRRALDRRPRSAPLEAELAVLLNADGQRRRAQRLFRRAALGEDADPGVTLDAALALSDPRRRDRALERLAERHPDYRAGRAWAALCAAVSGQRLWEAEEWAGPLEIPLEVEQQHFPVVTVELDKGVAARLLLDTGSTGLKISRPLAEALGAKPFGSLQVTGMGSSRPVFSDLVLIERLRLGGLVVRRVPATVLDNVPLGEGLLNPMALGLEAARFDLSRRLLILGDNEQVVPGEGARLAFADFDQHPLVRLTLNGRTHLAMIDSGSGATVLDESVVRQIPERRPMVIEGMEFSLSGVLGAVKDARPVHIARLALGPVALENPILFEADLSRFGALLGTDVQILFGADFLSRFDATFDYRRMELTLAPVAERRRKGVGLKSRSD